MTDHDSKRGKITEENLAEARRLRAIWLSKRAELAAQGIGTQEAFGAQFGIGNQAAVGFFLNGKTALSPKAAAGFARGLGCPIEDFSPRLAALLAAADPWPFPGIDRSRFDRLNSTQKAELQGAVRFALSSIEADAGNQRASGQRAPSSH